MLPRSRPLSARIVVAADVVTRPILGATEDFASVSFSTQQPPPRARAASGLQGTTCSGGNSLDSNTKSTTVLAAHAAVRPLAVALAAMSSAFTWMWNSCVCGVGCIHVCVWGMFACEHNNRHPLAPSIGSFSLLLQQRIGCAQK